MPSTTSSSFSRPEPSSTVITPSLPTFFIAVAMMSPILESLLAEMVPTCAIALSSAVGLESFFSSPTAAVTAVSMPRFRSIGFMPAATALRPAWMNACASTVAVVVPSPATSEVLEAASLTICAPRFSYLSASSISLATDTPSLVIVGAPKLFSSTTLRPFGPRVTLTALARVFTPLRMRERASSPKRTSLAAICLCPSNSVGGLRELGGRGRSAFDHRDDVVFLQEDQLFAVDLDFLAGVLAEQHHVAFLQAHRTDVAVFQDAAGAGGDDLAAGRLLGGAVGDDDAAGGDALLFQALDDDAIVQRTQFAHGQDST